MFKEGKSFNKVKNVVEGGIEKPFASEITGILKEKGITLDEFTKLRLKNINKLTESEKNILKSIRNSVPMPDENTMLQKVFYKDDIEEYMNGTYTQVGGFVTRAVDVAHLKTYDSIYDSLRLDYKNSDFKPLTDESLGLIRFKTDEVEKIFIPYGPEMGGTVTEDWPFTGNGFTKAENGEIIPEFRLKKYLDIMDGAKLFEIKRDGTEILKAIYSEEDNRFIPVE
ncbi:hypothetical protein [Eubacterium sp.]